MRCKGIGIFFLLQTFTKKSFNFVGKLSAMKNDSNFKSTNKGVFVHLPCVVDERGSLCFAENSHLPFEIKRVFWIYGVGENMTRGGHAHRSCAEVVFPVCGSFDIDIDDGISCSTYHLDNPNLGVLINANVWCCLRNFSPNTVCVVLASEEYDATGYIHCYESFKDLFR